MKHLELSLTQEQIYSIRQWVTENGYPEGCGLQGKHFYLISQSVIKDFEKRLDIILLTEKQGDKLKRYFKKEGFVKRKDKEKKK